MQVGWEIHALFCPFQQCNYVPLPVNTYEILLRYSLYLSISSFIITFSFSADYIKIFQNGGQKFHQDCEIEYSHADTLDCHFIKRTSESIYRDENTNENTITAVNMTCNSNMEVDKNMPSKNANAGNCGSQKLPSDLSSMNSSCNMDLEGNNLSSEVSAIYLAMKNSKLECVDEHGQVSMSTDGCVEDDENEEYDDFDPYLFIKNLPDLSSVVPTFRPLLLPKQTRSCPPTTLVLDLDGKHI